MGGKVPMVRPAKLRMQWTATLVGGLLLVGCPPRFEEFQVSESLDPPGTDGGPRTRAEADLGTPCGPSYVAVTIESLASSGTGQVRRFELPDLTACRDTTLAREHAAFGADLYSATAVGDGVEALGLDGALLRLDTEGFPEWRLQVDRTGGFHPLELFVLRVDGTDHLAAAHWGDRSSRMEGLLLVDPSGDIALDATEGLFGVNSAAPDPAVPGNVLVSRYGDLHTVPVTVGATGLEEGAEVLPRMTDLGTLVTVDADVESGRVVITYEQAVLQWHRPGGEMEGPGTCDAPCGSFHAATWDPTDPAAVLALCDDAGDGRIRHLVRVHLSGGCELAFDGTFLDDRRPTDLAIVQ